MKISMNSDVANARKFATRDEARQYINGASCDFFIVKEGESFVCQWSYDYLVEIDVSERLGR